MLRLRRVVAVSGSVVLVASSLVFGVSAGAAVTKTSHAVSVANESESTAHGGNSRDGWYPQAKLLTPSNVASSSFGQLFNVPITGQVYAQPLMDGSNVIVATEQNWVYAINQITGAKTWSVQVGSDVGAQPFNDVSPTVTSLQGWNCSDLTPYVGITSTPVVDPSTGTIYVVAMEQMPDGTLGYYMHALDGATGAEHPNFPVKIQGAAQNNPSAVFDAYNQLQRPALTLTNGVIYVGFSGHCDQAPYQGYVAGVSTVGSLRALWTDVSATNNFGGIWQAGGGFAVDKAGQLLIAVGNGATGTSPAGSIAGSTPPQALGESSVRLVAQGDGSLKATDFFTPYNSAALDTDDLDYGSGSPVILPNQFTTKSYPNLIVQTGKEGYVYLLNANHLGGVGQGPGGSDASVSQLGGYGGAWATPAVWPGNGGYIYIPTATGGTHSLGNAEEGDLNVFSVSKPSGIGVAPQLSLSAVGPTAMGFGSSTPVVTSNGTQNGSAVLWVVRTTDASGVNAQLQAYDAVPTAGSGSNPGTLRLINQWPIGTAMKFTPPGVANNRLYVPTKDGHLIAFGMNASNALGGVGASFGNTAIGKSASVTLSFTATKALSLSSADGTCAVCTKTSQFSIVSTSPAPVGGVINLAAKAKLTVTVSFAPVGLSGVRTDVLRLITSLGEIDYPLSGVAQAATAWVESSTNGLNLTGYIVGQKNPVSAQVRITNFGALPAKVASITTSLKPFVVSGPLKAGSVLAPGASYVESISFSSSTPGFYRKTFSVVTNTPAPYATLSIDLSAVASLAAKLNLDTPSVNFGAVVSGTPGLASATFSNTGGSTFTLNSVRLSDPAFHFLQPLSAGVGVVPGASVTLQILYTPTTNGPANSSLVISPAGMASGSITLLGYGIGVGYTVPWVDSKPWKYAGSASASGSDVTLTPNTEFQAGSTYWPIPLSSGSLTANFSAAATDGEGGDGIALVLADATTLPEGTLAPLGGSGSLVGYGGVGGVAIVIGEDQSSGAPSGSWVGVAQGTTSDGNNLNLLATAALDVSTQDTSNVYTVSFDSGTVTIWVNGLLVLTTALNLPSSYLVGFSAGTGLFTNTHTVSNASITVGGTQGAGSLSLDSNPLNVTANGSIKVGANIVTSETVTNDSGSVEELDPATVSGDGSFRVLSSSPVILSPGASQVEQIVFQPIASGTHNATLNLPINGGSSTQSVALSGVASGVGFSIGAFSSSNYSANGSATWVSGGVQLTGAVNFQAGSCISRTALGSTAVTASFDLSVTNPGVNYAGADGTALFFTPSTTASSAVGGNGGSYGFGGISGIGVVFSEEGESGNSVTSAGNFVAITNGPNGNGGMNYLAASALPESLFNNSTNAIVTESTSSGVTSISVAVDGVTVLSWATTTTKDALPRTIKVGVSAGTGGINDVHTVSNLVVTAGV